MAISDYPKHDINELFSRFEKIISEGGTADNAHDELILINRLFSALPAEAVEYGMRFLHGTTDLPSSCDDLMPLFIRFRNLAEYMDKIESLKVIPDNPDTDFIMKRQKDIESLETHEKMFGMNLLGYTLKPVGDGKEAVPEEEAAESGSSEAKDSGSLHLMNASAIVFACKDIFATSLFYETRLGFKAVHLSDESMEHIRLTRDNIVIILTPASKDSPLTMRELYGIDYDLYIYASEPFLLQNELKSAGVDIVESLPDASDESLKSRNRQFVFEDNDKRRICVSQSTEIV